MWSVASVLKPACAHKRVLQSWYLINTQTASQLAGATLAFQLLSQLILKVTFEPETEVPVMVRLFAFELIANKKRNAEAIFNK